MRIQHGQNTATTHRYPDASLSKPYSPQQIHQRTRTIRCRIVRVFLVELNALFGEWLMSPLSPSFSHFAFSAFVVSPNGYLAQSETVACPSQKPCHLIQKRILEENDPNPGIRWQVPCLCNLGNGRSISDLCWVFPHPTHLGLPSSERQLLNLLHRPLGALLPLHEMPEASQPPLSFASRRII